MEGAYRLRLRRIGPHVGPSKRPCPGAGEYRSRRDGRPMGPSETVPLMSSLRVIHVVLSLDVGGLERIVVDLVREGGRLGQRVSVLCLERPGTLAPQVEALGSAVVCTGKRRGMRVETIGRIEAVLRDQRP